MNGEHRDQDIPLTEVTKWAEFACWAVSVLAPIIYFLNGPSVSADQFIARTVLIAVAMTGAVFFRLINGRMRSRT